MEKDEYLIGGGLKIDLHIEDCSIDLFFPESHELQYPLEIYYTRYDYNGSGVVEMDTIVSAEDYLFSLECYRERDYKILSIGSINFQNLRNYLFKFNQKVYNLSRTVSNIQYAAIQLIKTHIPDYKLNYNGELDAIHHFDMELKQIIDEIESIIPRTTSSVYPRK